MTREELDQIIFKLPIEEKKKIFKTYREMRDQFLKEKNKVAAQAILQLMKALKKSIEKKKPKKKK